MTTTSVPNAATSPGVLAPKRRGSATGRRRDGALVAALLAPAALVFSVVILYPVVRGIITSFQDAKIANRDNAPWIGFGNYIEIFASGRIQTYMGNTLIFVVSVVAALLVLGMVISLLLNSDIPLRKFARSIVLLPWIVPSVVVAMLWSWIFQPQYGILNYLLGSLGLVPFDQQWTQNPNLAMFTVIVAAVWRELPLMTLLLLAGLQSVPDELLEAAQIDGAGAIRRFVNVVLPSIRPTVVVATLICVINNFQSFTLIYTMTAGGPINRTTTLSIGAWTAAFQNYELGIGSAIGVVWMLLLVVLGVASRLLDKREN